MGRSHYHSTAVIVLLCLLGTQSNGITVFASDAAAAATTPPPSATATTTIEPPSRLVIDLSGVTLAAPSNAVAQRRGFRGRGRNEGSRTALVVGTLAAITGASLLVYANRPECDRNASASACSYGTKVIGGAVLAAGAVGIVAGTISWR